ncbi:MAG: 50S ribosomal protein L15 [Patescibacteria group bacterium]|nr:50S ribosomal protein L15 [Patescibacteria group bacterium]MDD4304626.1 50S ribosomal protein L15 [Patescibacteria group bacterium]MDD4695553.1 50S ribosomal protein L15 [Patescibacteria group bacterium]
MLTLSNLKINKKSKSKKQRLGRGNSSGRGNYSGRGMKGQRSRSGGKSGLKRLGMKKLIAQLPKHRGFNRISEKFEVLNLSILESKFNTGDEVSVKTLLKLDLVSSIKANVKILGKGNLTKKLKVKAHDFSKSAKEAIIKAGGEVIETPKFKKKPTLKKSKRVAHKD